MKKTLEVIQAQLDAAKKCMMLNSSLLEQQGFLRRPRTCASCPSGASFDRSRNKPLRTTQHTYDSNDAESAGDILDALNIEDNSAMDGELKHGSMVIGLLLVVVVVVAVVANIVVVALGLPISHLRSHILCAFTAYFTIFTLYVVRILC